MITDEQYKRLLERVDALENRVIMLAQEYSALYMKSDVQPSRRSPVKSERKRKDTTKYMFMGKLYGKRDLVLQCVKSFVADKHIKSEKKLTEAFPPYVQGSLGIVRRVQEAERYSDATKRYFFSDQDIIHLSDGDFVVSSQWDAGNIGAFLQLAHDLGYEIETISRKYI